MLIDPGFEIILQRNRTSNHYYMPHNRQLTSYSVREIMTGNENAAFTRWNPPPGPWWLEVWDRKINADGEPTCMIAATETRKRSIERFPRDNAAGKHGSKAGVAFLASSDSVGPERPPPLQRAVLFCTPCCWENPKSQCWTKISLISGLWADELQPAIRLTPTASVWNELRWRVHLRLSDHD
jgi:hypothetical protein